MIIATWNVERLKHSKSLGEITALCERAKADILVLTETDERIRPNLKYSFHTPNPPSVSRKGVLPPVEYRPTENRVSIFTNYDCIGQHPTFDPYTALCIEVETEKGRLLVYGTVIGIFGNRDASFERDLLCQIKDINRLSADNHALCICGDFNCSFADNYYFTRSARSILRQCFNQNQIRLLTESAKHCVDHIAVSLCYVDSEPILIEEWNTDKSLSDHKGVSASFS